MRHLLFFAMCLSLTMCKPNSSDNTNEEAADTTKTTTPTVNPTSSNRCYAYAKNEDIIGLTLTLDGEKVSGKLAYALMEKDRNSGTIEGHWKGDTLIADYTFHSEGMLSVREIIFLKRNDTLVEAYGEVEQVGNKMIFKSRKNLKFLDNFPMSRVPCTKSGLMEN